VDQSNLVIEEADLDVVHREILEGPRLGDEVEELGTVAGDTRSLRDEIFGEESQLDVSLRFFARR